MKYDYAMIIDTDVHTGNVEGNDPRSAAENIIRIRTDWMDESFANLEPVITVWREADGTFRADVDSHGLGDAGIVLEQSA